MAPSHLRASGNLTVKSPQKHRGFTVKTPQFHREITAKTP